jgi:hypothetical protein
MNGRDHKTYPTPRMSVLVMLQSVYFFITAVWPLVHIKSFMWVTGYKTDVWLVKTVSAILVPISLTMAFHLLLKTDHRPLLLLGLSTNISFICIDVYYSLTNVISDIYLVDAAIQGCFLIAWILMSGVFRDK